MLQQYEFRCKYCAFFVPYTYDLGEGDEVETDYGECRRFPPKPVPAEECGFPVVEDSTWCGEFSIRT